jgi:ribonuclease BN (tRNA processing enzyme)
MEIFLLGSGTAIPVPQHSTAGLILKAGGQQLLFDIGPGTLTRLHLADVECGELDHLLLTHLHPDHTLDLATLLLVYNYAPGAERKRPFEITGCRGLAKFYKRMVDLYPEVAPSTFELEFRETHRDQFEIGKLRIRTAPTGHTPDSVAYRVEDDEHAVVYSGDAAPQGELAQLAEGADVMVSECSFPAGWPSEDHLNADTLGDIAERAGVKTLVTVHAYPPALEVDLVGQLQSRYRGRIVQGVDGLRIAA